LALQEEYVPRAEFKPNVATDLEMVRATTTNDLDAERISQVLEQSYRFARMWGFDGLATGYVRVFGPQGQEIVAVPDLHSEKCRSVMQLRGELLVEHICQQLI
jgi:hypothetical protein